MITEFDILNATTEELIDLHDILTKMERPTQAKCVSRNMITHQLGVRSHVNVVAAIWFDNRLMTGEWRVT